MQPAQPLLEKDKKPKVMRPAAIVIRFTGEDTNDSPFRRAVKLYSTILDQDSEKNGEEGDYKYYSFRVGSTPKPGEKKDIELRLELWKKDDTELKDRTVIYWEIFPHNDKPATEQIMKKLASLGYDNPVHELTPKSDDSFVMRDSSNYLFGGSPNPTFPFSNLIPA